MDDTKGKPIAVKDKYGNITGYRGSGAGAGQVEAEDPAEAYQRTKGKSREEWPGQHASEIKRLQREENASRKKAGRTDWMKYPDAEPSPVPEMPKKK